MSKARAPIEAVEVFQMVNRINDAGQAAARKEHGTHVAGEYDAGEKSADTSHELAKARTHMAQISLGLLCLLLLTSTFCFAKQKHHLFGWAENGPCDPASGLACADVYPLLNAQGDPIQWNAPTFSGFLMPGSYDGLKKDVCKGTRTCYWYDGRGNWEFRLTGWAFCANTCTYMATGDLVVSNPILLPDGSTTTQISAVLNGTYADDQGAEYPNLMGYYSSYTAPTKGVGWPTQTIAQGGITIVLADN